MGVPSMYVSGTWRSNSFAGAGSQHAGLSANNEQAHVLDKIQLEFGFVESGSLQVFQYQKPIQNLAETVIEATRPLN